jgi:hypothetical protein
MKKLLAWLVISLMAVGMLQVPFIGGIESINANEGI